jgi:phage host-nuclease inhibitor protein Gam
MTTRKNINVLENTIRDIVSEAKADGIRQEIEAAYKAVKEVKNKLRELGKMNKETKVLKAAARKMVDELEDLEDLDMEEEVTEEEEETIRKNEQSEGYGSWQGLGMSESYKLTDSDMNTIIKIAHIKKGLMEDVSRTFSVIRKRIIKERIDTLKVNDYSNRVITEQSEWRGHNPGVSAAAGIENIIDNLKKGWSMIKDSTTRKQIQNTLVKLNNFMMYSAELIGSGSSQRAPRSYEQLANPLPFPDLDEPEDLEDIDDGLEDFDKWMDDLADKHGTTDH